MGSVEIADFVVESFEAAAAAVLIVIVVVVGVVDFVGVPAGILLFVAAVESELIVIAAKNPSLLDLVTLRAGEVTVALLACAGPMTEDMQ